MLTLLTAIGIGAATGCAGASVGTVLAVLPVVRATAQRVAAGPRVPGGRRLVPDDGRAWTKQILTTENAPAQPGAHRADQTVRVRWELPIEIAGTTRAVAGVGDASCVTATAASPIVWAIGRDGGSPGAAGVGEVWFASRATLSGVDRRPAQRRVGYLEAARLAQRLGLGSKDEVTWLLLVPKVGHYRLTMVYEDTDPRAALAAQPCVRAWVDVPLEWAVETTLGHPVIATSEPDQGASSTALTAEMRDHTDASGPITDQSRVDTRDAGASLIGDNAVTSAGAVQSEAEAARAAMAGPVDAAATLRRPVRGQAPTEIVTELLGLVGAAEYDLARLHQGAMELELARRDPSIGGGTGLAAYDSPALIDALRALRATRLESLRQQGPRGHALLCFLARRHGLGDQPMAVWADESTVPVADLRGCPPRPSPR